MSLSDEWAGNSEIWEGCPDRRWQRKRQVSYARLEPLEWHTIGNRGDLQRRTVRTRDVSDLEVM